MISTVFCFTGLCFNLVALAYSVTMPFSYNKPLPAWREKLGGWAFPMRLNIVGVSLALIGLLITLYNAIVG